MFPYCKQCNRQKSLNVYYNDKEYGNKIRKEWRDNNKAKMRGLKRIWYLNNKEYRDNYVRNFQQNNKDKIKSYNQKHQGKTHNITIKEWEACKKYFIHRCAYCGLVIEEHYIKRKGELQLGDFHREHVIHEGSNKLKNCIPACKSCNSEKWEFTFNEWYNPFNPRFNLERYRKICKWIKEDYKKFGRHNYKF